LFKFFLNPLSRRFASELRGTKLAGRKIERGKAHAIANRCYRRQKLFSSAFSDESAAVPA